MDSRENKDNDEIERRSNVVEDFISGAEIEFTDGSGAWVNCPNPTWLWGKYDFRVKVMEDKEELERRNGIIEAYHEGHEIEHTITNPVRSDYRLWYICPRPLWSWELYDYRIKEEVLVKAVCDIGEQIKVMQAFKDRQKIEVSKKNCNIWVLAGAPAWNWLDCDYRIKEEEVLPCPFCGAEGELFTSNIDDTHSYSCSADTEDCAVKPVSDCFKSKDKALEEWNKRI